MKNVTPDFELVDDDLPPRKSFDSEPRLRRLRALAWFLDRAFALGKTRRFGVEPLIGLIPAVGDWIGGIFSLYILYEAARLGISWRVLARMALNILLEVVVGTIPIAGDIFDFIWQANMRNVQLVETHFSTSLKSRPVGGIVLPLIIAAALLLFSAFALGIALGVWLWHLLS
ncbi:MAG TPA: DUF4112 domain-containing protein [Opitutaceae bacterium]|nr:DUF4112 domain-containing protein [Opitutaceae bacterium]